MASTAMFNRRHVYVTRPSNADPFYGSADAEGRDGIDQRAPQGLQGPPLTAPAERCRSDGREKRVTGADRNHAGDLGGPGHARGCERSARTGCSRRMGLLRRTGTPAPAPFTSALVLSDHERLIRDPTAWRAGPCLVHGWSSVKTTPGGRR